MTVITAQCRLCESKWHPIRVNQPRLSFHNQVLNTTWVHRKKKHCRDAELQINLVFLHLRWQHKVRRGRNKDWWQRWQTKTEFGATTTELIPKYECIYKIIIIYNNVCWALSTFVASRGWKVLQSFNKESAAVSQPHQNCVFSLQFLFVASSEANFTTSSAIDTYLRYRLARTRLWKVSTCPIYK